MADFRNLNEALEALKGKAIQTSQGSFIKLGDLEELLTQFRATKVEQRVDPLAPRTFSGAKKAARNDEELKAAFAKPPEQAVAAEAFKGQAVPSATEGVKS